MNGNLSEPQTPLLVDRRTSLMVFGILVILLGCLFALFVPVMLFAQMTVSRVSGASSGLRNLMPVILTYGSMAVAFIWLGIGSIKARRWARSLLVIIAWSWLGVGVMT